MQLWTVKAPRALTPPIAPPKLIFPVPAVMVRFCVPFRVLENVTFPTPEPLEIEVVPVSATAFVNKIAWLTVRSVPERETGPPPV